MITFLQKSFKFIFSVLFFLILLFLGYTLFYEKLFNNTQQVYIQVSAANNGTKMRMQRIPQVVIIGVSKCGKFEKNQIEN